MLILRSLLLLVVLFTPALGEDGSRAAARAKDAAQALQLYLDKVAKSGERPDYERLMQRYRTDCEIDLAFTGQSTSDF